MNDNTNMPQTVQPTSDGTAPNPQKERHDITLKRPVFILLIVGIIAALLGGYFGGRLSIVSRANTVISQKNARIEDLKTSLSSVKKQLADANQRLSPSDSDRDDSDNDVQQGKTGEIVTNGGIEMKLISASEQSTINYDTCGDGCSNGEYAPKSPDEGTKYWIATVEVKNNTKKPLDITCGYPYEIIALNSKNQQYTPIQDLYQVQGNPECNAQLQPGLSTQTTYPFQVPLDAKMTAIAFRDVGDLTTGEDGEDEYSYLIVDDSFKAPKK